MAIVTENITINGKAFVRTYSDAGMYVVGGEPYGEYPEAIDPAEYARTYAESKIPIKETFTEEEALVRYSNELTGENDQTLEEATETLLKIVKEVN